jgi:phosphoribosylaminoimidazole-succinocarboxamide synthase
VKALIKSDFNFPDQTNYYKGKVREVYSIKDDLLVMVASDRLSAFDVVLPKGIPFKGQVLNQLASKFLDYTSDIVPNWKLAAPDPNVTLGIRCEPLKVEMVIRGYMSGHAWRTYRSGKRVLCGVELPEGMKENDKFPKSIITPSTKADQGLHDEDISKEEILSQGLVAPEVYAQLEEYTHQLFERGSQWANERGLILVDTKYEFGMHNGQIMLMDEIHTPDSSRYFYKEGYAERQEAGEAQKQLSKEFVRQWLIENGFQGLEGQTLPDMSDEFIETISDRYIELYENITGEKFVKGDYENIEKRIEKNVVDYLKTL